MGETGSERSVGKSIGVGLGVSTALNVVTVIAVIGGNRVVKELQVQSFILNGVIGIVACISHYRS